MTSSGWSSLLLGTILATTVFGSAVAQTSPGLPATVAEAVTSSGDEIAAAIDAARTKDGISEEEIDRILTGSIAAIQPGPRTGGLSEVRPASTGGLVEPKLAPEPAPKPVAAEPAKTVAPPVTPAKDATAASEAAPQAPTPAAEVKAIAPAPISAPVEAPVEPARPVDAGLAAPSSNEVATTAPATDATATAEAATQPATPTEAASAEAKAVEADAAPAGADKFASAGRSSTSSEGYSTASEPKPATPEAVTAAPAAPETTIASAPPSPAVAPAPVVVAPAPVVAAAPAPVVASAPAPVVATAPAPVAPKAAEPVVAAPAAPVVAQPAPSTDAAIAATLATEQAATALQAALKDLQPLAGTAEERADRAGLLAFYADRAFLPLFVDAQGATDRARAVGASIGRADRDGLELKDYPLPRGDAGLAPEVRAKAEIDFARITVRFARHLQSGRFDPLRVHQLVTPKVTKTEAREVLTRVATSSTPGATLDAYAPPHEGYRRLKALLADLRGTPKEAPMVMLPVGPTLKPGQKDARVALLRERLGVGVVVSDAELYDPSLAEAVKAFQRERGLAATGSVGRETVTALNGEKNGTASRIADVISNMERWRWLPRELGDMHVYVNTADYHLDVMKDGRSIHHARVIVGSPSHPTPIFSETMQYVVVNPYWNVPYSIVKNEMVGKAQASAGAALSRGAWEVEVGNRAVDPTTVDWSTVDASKVTIRQKPGAGNALGNIKFMFPNQHSVYIHDTSSRGLFSQSYRALSHGCVRVHEPFSFADAVLSEEPDKLDGARLKKMIGGSEKELRLKRTVPVHITYFTAFVDDAGQLQTRPDVYGHDARVKRLLGL